jgi:hypothetical protein
MAAVDRARRSSGQAATRFQLCSYGGPALIRRYLRGAPSLLWVIYTAGWILYRDDPASWCVLYEMYWLPHQRRRRHPHATIEQALARYSTLVAQEARRRTDELSDGSVSSDWRERYLPDRFIELVARMSERQLHANQL